MHYFCTNFFGSKHTLKRTLTPLLKDSISHIMRTSDIGLQSSGICCPTTEPHTSPGTPDRLTGRNAQTAQNQLILLIRLLC